MEKIKIALGYLAFPFCLANYFRRSLERRNDVELFTFGPFTGQYIPWSGGMNIPMKYSNHVDLPLPQNVTSPSWEMIKNKLPWKPDLILNIDAGFHFSTKPDIPYAVVGTDPHVLGDWYNQVRHLTDKFFNMQYSYMQSGDELLPYAFDPFCHYPMSKNTMGGISLSFDDEPVMYYRDGDMKKEYDTVLVGLHYPHRDEWVRRLREIEISVNYRIGDIYDEYREENNKAWIGLNWSSLEDVTARVFEIMAMRLVPVINRLPGLDALGFEDGRHYLGFSSMDEAVNIVIWAKEHREQAEQISLNAYQYVHNQKMTYDQRCTQILTKMGLL